MKEIYKKSLVNSILTVAYIAIVALVMQNGERLFGEMDNGYLAPVAFLLLFTLSALIVGVLLLWKPIALYLDNKKKEAVLWLSASIGWMALFTIIALIVLAVK